MEVRLSGCVSYGRRLGIISTRTNADLKLGMG